MKRKDERKSILIVDDVAKNIQVIAGFLKGKNYNLNFAQNGAEAIQHALNQNFDLILLDIMMPEMDGFDVCKKLKSNKKTKDIPVIFITAKTDDDSISKGFEFGGVDYITKPFNAAELVARIKTHLSLSEKEKQLKELNSTKDKFFSIVAHDLKNPFFNIMGLSDLLSTNIKEYNIEEIRDIAETMSLSAKQAYNLLENLLNWSRVQTGRIGFSPEKLQLHQLVNINIELLNTNAQYKNIKIVNQVNKNTIIFADENMVNTILRNLLSNAIKFTNNKGKVKIYAGNEGEFVTITVADNGLGMSKESIQQLFKLDKSHSTLGTKKETGTGLGLILCKEFVELNRGEINVESTEGVGTNITFTLPLAKE
ncbi:MAG: hybrid sensor histidine kinase/response regulator [Bacteroidales bacterium]|nr:hybrid sensor histidine kinase/response regulator [Bacteroidales bacterium]